MEIDENNATEDTLETKEKVSSNMEVTENIISDKEMIVEAVREIHKSKSSACPRSSVDSKTLESDKTTYVFKGTKEQLYELIKEVIMEDPETKAFAKKVDEMLEQWDKALEKKEEESKERACLINELEKELDLLNIEYEATCQQRRAREQRMGKSQSKESQIQSQSKPVVPSTDDDDDDDIEIIEEIKIKPYAETINANSGCYAVKSGDLWRRAFVVSVSNSYGKPGEELYRVKMDRQTKVVKKSQVAHEHPPNRAAVRGTRIIALYKEMTGALDYYSGIVAEPPYQKNNHRYLVFFDDGCAQYTKQSDIRVIAHQFDKPWEGLTPDLQEFVKHYMETYNQRMILRLKVGQTVLCEKDGDWFKARCLRVDCSLVKMLFENANITEWIYRGSTRFEPLYELHYKRNQEAKARQEAALAAARLQPPSQSQAVKRPAPPFKPPATKPVKTHYYKAPSAHALANRISSANQHRGLSSKGISFQPRDEHAGNRIKTIYPQQKLTKYVPHECGEGCIKVDDDPKKYKGKYTLTVPIYVGFERFICRTTRTKSLQTSNKKFVVYKGPCGRRIRNIKEMGDYLFITKSNLTIDLFSFEQALHLFEPFVATNIMMSITDLSQGLEEVNISCVNALNTARPDPLVYANVRMPQKDVDLNTNTDFMVCCDCTDNCQDKTSCACQKLTYEGQQFLQPTLPLEKSGYLYRRLDENIVTGVYECNSKCSCRQTCFNRVVQNSLRTRLQIFKTEKRGWGIRCLDDVPNGGFICIYAGQLLSEEGADQGGREYGDEYFAELDFIETCENVKEGYEEEVVDPGVSFDDADNEKDKSDSDWQGSSSGSEADSALSSNKDLRSKSKKKTGLSSSSTKSTFPSAAGQLNAAGDNLGGSAAAAAEPKPGPPTASEKKPPMKSIRSYFDEDLPYVMDAKTSGNLGRYLNHSCDPNVFVQNVFVDTHDPRFPWIAFFANTFIRAGSELTWDYGYQPGIVEGKVMYCYCGSSNCRGRLL